MVAIVEFGRSKWSGDRAAFRPSAMGAAVQRGPVLGQTIRLAVRPAAAVLGDAKTDAAVQIADKLTTAANEIVKNGADLSTQLDRVYMEYQNSATQNRLLGALRAAYNMLRATDPLLAFITGNPDNQALVKLQGAERLGNQWMTSLKDNWYGDATGVNLHEALMVVDNDLALQVESTFDAVQNSTADVSKLSRQVQQLPEEILSRGVDYFYAGLKSAAGEVWFDISSIFKAIKAILDAAGVASNDISNFLNATFPKPKGSGPGGTGTASSFPAPGTLILLGLGAVALYMVLK